MLRLLVRCSSLGERFHAAQEASNRGLSARVLRHRPNGDLVVGVPLAQYDAVLKWWGEGGRLIRTLGPEEAN
ncbi:MAG: hypothetical protein WAT39_01880 [Planctomycetota bacterium]